MISSKQYVPVLRWKQSEQDALRTMFPSDTPRMAPLIIIQRPAPKAGAKSAIGTVQACLDRDATAATIAWSGRPLVVDATILDGHAPVGVQSAASYLFSRFASLHPDYTPLSELSKSANFQSDVRVAAVGRGAAIRLRDTDLANPNLGASLTTLLAALGLAAGQIDLIVDLAFLPLVPPPRIANLGALLAGIPYLSDWRSFVLTSGVFPANLTGFGVGNHFLARDDWALWHGLLSTPLPRYPTFGDYTTQHPLPVSLPIGAVPSASVRYALPDRWLIMRGNSVAMARGGGYGQYIAHAHNLVASPHFMGAAYSAGDAYIEGRTHPGAKSGSAQTWLTAGVNHHMTLTVRQLASLPGF